ncbi:MAG TPA: STAS domain-containing protein [Microthrixaceae bacterium]|nr:STAS domain-containing protein [Microthrixaceae bacterium]
MECKLSWYEVIVDPRPLLRVGGELDLDASPSLRCALADLVDRLDGGTGDVVEVDLSEVTFFGVAGYRAIEEVVRERGVIVELCRPSRPSRRLLELLDAPDVLTPALVGSRAVRA